MQAAALTLGIDSEKMGNGSSSFTQLGGDSLAAIQFAREVDELCGTHLPVSFVLDHSHSMQDIVAKVSSWYACVLHVSWPIGVHLLQALQDILKDLQLPACPHPQPCACHRSPADGQSLRLLTTAAAASCCACWGDKNCSCCHEGTIEPFMRAHYIRAGHNVETLPTVFSRWRTC